MIHHIGGLVAQMIDRLAVLRGQLDGKRSAGTLIGSFGVGDRIASPGTSSFQRHGGRERGGRPTFHILGGQSHFPGLFHDFLQHIVDVARQKPVGVARLVGVATRGDSGGERLQRRANLRGRDRLAFGDERLVDHQWHCFLFECDHDILQAPAKPERP